MDGRVLVTGAAGFIGSHLIDALKQNLPPKRVFAHIHHGSARPPYIYAGDLTNARAVQRFVTQVKPALIFHTAGAFQGTDQQLFAANVLSTLHLIHAAFAQNRHIRIILLGSAAEYGNSPMERARERKLAPLNAYGWSKTYQTQLAQRLSALGVNIVMARLFNLTGPRLPQRFIAGNVACQIVEAEAGLRQRLEVGNERARRDFIDVRDAVRGILQIAKRGRTGEVYEVCSGKDTSIKEIIRLLLQETSCRLPIHSKVNPRRGQEIRVSMGNPRQIRDWGWSPKISLKQSLRDTLEYYRACQPR